jgi:hypothetical protein
MNTTPTPRTDSISDSAWDGATDDYSAYSKMLCHARQLERELSAAKDRHAKSIISWGKEVATALESKAKSERELAEAREQLDTAIQEATNAVNDIIGVRYGVKEARVQRDRLAEALEGILENTPMSLCCEDFHHPSKDRHAIGCECPPTNRFRAAWSNAEKALAAVKGENP